MLPRSKFTLLILLILLITTLSTGSNVGVSERHFHNDTPRGSYIILAMGEITAAHLGRTPMQMATVSVVQYLQAF
jgi:hypothetical protein